MCKLKLRDGGTRKIKIRYRDYQIPQGAAPTRPAAHAPIGSSMLDKISLRNPALMPTANLIGGEWTTGSETIPVTNPAAGILLGTVPNGGRSETRRAIEAAARAFPAWRAKTAAERADVLRRLQLFGGGTLLGPGSLGD